MNIEEPSVEFDRWLGEWFWEGAFTLPDSIWSPTTSDYQAREVLEAFIKRVPGWYVEMVYDVTCDFPWIVMLRPLDGFDPEYTPMQSGYPLCLLMCKAVILALTNGEIYDTG
jgi:hypothetical protein